MNLADQPAKQRISIEQGPGAEMKDMFSPNPENVSENLTLATSRCL
jgi:hypothetical protein